MYQIKAGPEILYQGFSKYAAFEIWQAVQGAQVPATLFYCGEVLDIIDPLDLTIEDPFDFGDADLDDLDGFEFL
jgi:hypothetical protein